METKKRLYPTRFEEQAKVLAPQILKEVREYKAKERAGTLKPTPANAPLLGE